MRHETTDEDSQPQMYTVEIQAGDEAGYIWQAVEPAETIDLDTWRREWGGEWSASEVARAVAVAQEVATGDHWRVRVWPGTVEDAGGTAPVTEVYAEDLTPQDEVASRCRASIDAPEEQP